MTSSGQNIRGLFGMHKESILTLDHSGWYLLNGRAMALLPPGAQAQAVALGLGAALADLTNRTMIDGAAYGTVAGATTVALTQANLPAFVIAGTMDAQVNNHNHGFVVTGGQVRRQAGSNQFRSGTPQGGQGQPRNITLTAGGAHAHTWPVPSGGGGVALNVEAAYLSVRFFIFLGE